MHHPVGTRRVLDAHEGAERNHVARGVAGLEPDDVLGLQTESRFRLGGDRVGAAEGVEIVHIQRPQVHLHGVEELLHGHALRLRFFAIDLGIDLRHVHLVTREQALQLRGLISLGHQVLRLPIQLLEAEAPAVLDLHAKAADRPQPHHRRRRKHGDEGVLNLAVLLIEGRCDRARG